MTRVFVAAGVVLSALPLGVVLWGREQGATSSQPAEDMTKSTSSSISSPESQSISTRSQNKSEQSEPAYTKLGNAFAWVPDQDTARMGYYDPEAKAFYAWKGVVIPVEQIPGFDSPFQGFPLDIRALAVTEVDPPPTYYIPLADEFYAPGFYDGRWTPRFYRWKGIRLKKDQIPAEAFKKYVLREGLVKYPIDIDPPPFARKRSGR